MKLDRMLSVFLSILFSLVLFTSVARAQEEINFFLPISEGLAGGTFSDMLEKMGKKVTEHTGIKFNYTEESYKHGFHISDELVYKRLKSGETNMTYVVGSEYVADQTKWDEIFRPAFTIVMNGKNYDEYCLFGRKGEIKSVADTKDKVWGGMSTIPTRLLLYENGIDEPLSEYFSKMVYVNESPVTNYITALEKGEIDVFVAINGQLMLSKNNKNEKLVHEKITCVEGPIGWIFGFRKDVSEDVAKKITRTLLDVHKDPDFSEFHFMFYAIKGNFELFKPKYLEKTKEIFKMVKDKGWDKEEEEYREKLN